ncbi:hypothetical protein PCL_03457 [Purpureocillium lilacinum]|uniref:Uncharacterized protein n=1 Tax=Purpureocillium lilacinum TaxID=33203 RepID=A0A2U3EP41_PURLI|nr:hypothetical protein Purlil1_4984 [Purpureocillium lilacinum]PWI76263.1 hypothetical protein PCL_03457 [Purpureocillium lilacinum]
MNSSHTPTLPDGFPQKAATAAKLRPAAAPQLGEQLAEAFSSRRFDAESHQGARNGGVVAEYLIARQPRDIHFTSRFSAMRSPATYSANILAAADKIGSPSRCGRKAGSTYVIRKARTRTDYYRAATSREGASNRAFDDPSAEGDFGRILSLTSDKVLRRRHDTLEIPGPCLHMAWTGV